ncbi:uncharacterized protein LOC114364741 [Ostrinia furnacalis]|uniref:uncharacterized protein LOC114364741 n=1 Tax=Ostrinia furnacalis TaxID=93504 RepID=UPI001039946A|nr:uncharacterized protein LOC114364741 [Ostrinia furnacalis]
MVIKSLEFSSENYIIAWDLLENRYNNNRLLVQNHVKALFNIASLNKESSVQIRKLIDNILKNMRALKTLGEPTESWDTLIIYLITSKLDSCTEREWEYYKGTLTQTQSGTRLKLNDILDFLKNRADVLETINLSHSKGSTTSDNNIKNRLNTQNKSHSFVTTQNKQSNTLNKNNSKRSRNCSMCNDTHPLYACNSFLNLSVKDKISFLKEKKLCFNCLRAGHILSECWFGPCKICNQKHNSLIHSDDASTSSAMVQVSESQNAVGSHSSNTNLLHSAAHASNTHKINTSHSLLENVLLSTALVEIADANNTYHTTRALLDNGSQHCFISQSLCQKLNVPLIQSTVQVTGVGNSVTHSSKSCDINLKSKYTDYSTRLKCLVLSQITAQLPALNSKLQISVPKNIQLADPYFQSQTEIELLIGADKFWDLLNDGLIRLNSGPYLQNTKLGWIISGPIKNKTFTRINRVQCNYSQSLDTQLRKFWELEEITSCNKLTKDELICEKLFNETTYRDDAGRFFVRIPLAKASDTLGDSYALAQNRFFALERKLDRSSPEYKKLYCDFMNEYIQLGHMTRINNYTFPNYFLPHHGVLREHSTTTKLRVVFDASAKTTSGQSLNDIQLIGPCLQNDVFSILLRFRQFNYVACADIEKMYRQINIQSDQRNLQLIIWRENKSDELGVYQLNTVTYGTASAPYLSIRCIKQLALECEDDVIKRIIDEDFFVDDLVTGHDNKDTLMDICGKVSDILKSACFPLRKWMFNLEPSHSKITKELSIDPNFTNVTKRIILSVISQIYDPLGLLSPVIIIAKILLQRLWLCKLGWDDSVPNDICNEWHNFINTFQCLQNIRIPRHVREPHSKYTDLHIFTDASQDAYGACAYVSTYSDDSPVLVRLLCAKSKVAPIKPVTMPRLELCGALVGAKLFKKISESWRISFNNVYFWSDSMIVVSWVKMSPNLLKPFVQNRVVQINDLTGELPWRHVAGKDNPADLLSRGLPLDALQQSDIWWHGPEFLREIKNESSQNDVQVLDMCEIPELKSNNCTISCLAKLNNAFPFERFSNWNRMRRTMCYVLRFINNLRIKNKSQRSSGPFSSKELTESVNVLAKFAQQESHPDVYHALVNNLPIKSRHISGLDVFLDNSGLIRVGGRLQNSEHYSYNKKHPILLSSKHIFSQLLFRFEHIHLLHAGPQLLLATIRDSWWVLRGRDLAKQTVHKCISCTRQRGKTLNIKMGNLPSERLEPGYPFQRCGVDYAGPVFILNRRGRGAKLSKCYICLFVCFTTRAVHLELVTSLSSEAYLLALRRFLSRRGKPAEIFSDNGKTFVGALIFFHPINLVKFMQLKYSKPPLQNVAAPSAVSSAYYVPCPLQIQRANRSG